MINGRFGLTFIGTNSPVINEKDCCPDAARPINVVPPMRVPTVCAVALTIHPISARAADPIKNHYIMD
jgi:hypothetical protein